MFAVGDLVICIRGATSNGWFYHGEYLLGPAPEVGKIYTVSGVEKSFIIYVSGRKERDGYHIYLQELPPVYNPDGDRCGYDPERFRKVIDFKDAMEKAEKAKKTQGCDVHE